MTDPHTFFNQYAVPADVEVHAHGGRPLVATFDQLVLEGAWKTNWSIVLEFPSLRAARDWYYSPRYQAVLPYRYASTAFGNMAILEGIPQSVLDWRLTEYENVAARLIAPLTLDATPEYILTLAAECKRARGRLRLSAFFDAVDLLGADLNLELRLQSMASPGAIEARIFLKDAAGHRQSLGKLALNGALTESWQRFEAFNIGQARTTEMHGMTKPVDLKQINAVEIDFRLMGHYVGSLLPIQIRNLKISRRLQ